MMVNRLNLVLRCSLILFGMVSMPCVSLAVIHPINLDLGIDAQQTQLPGWNNLTGPALTEPTNTVNLIDTFGAATGITLTPTWSAMDNDTGVALPAANFQGRYPDELPGISQSALRDNVWVRDGQSLTLTLNNLPANSRLQFLVLRRGGRDLDRRLLVVDRDRQQLGFRLHHSSRRVTTPRSQRSTALSPTRIKGSRLNSRDAGPTVRFTFRASTTTA